MYFIENKGILSISIKRRKQTVSILLNLDNKLTNLKDEKYYDCTAVPTFLRLLIWPMRLHFKDDGLLWGWMEREFHRRSC